jgi:hypothetical protein
MKLFKYIDFDKDYSGQPLLEGSLYFASIEELRHVVNNPARKGMAE